MKGRPNNYFDDIPIHRKQFCIMFIVVLAYFFDQMDGTVVGYVAPSVMKSFGITIQEFAPAQSLYFIGMMLGGIVAGFISDKIGRRKAFLCGCSMFTFATLLTGFTNDIKWFTLFRVLTGFGVLGTGAICTTYLSEVLSASDRSKYYGICTGLGLFAVPAIGVVSTWVILMSDEAWRYLFWQGALGLLPLTLGFVFMKESPRWLIAQGRQAEAEAVVEAYCGEKIDLTEVAERARIERDTRPSFTETLRQIFIVPKYRYRSLVLFFIAAGQNIPSFVLLGWNTTLLQANGVDQASSLIISTIGSIGSPVGTIISGYVGTFGGRKLSIGIHIILIGLLVLAYMLLPYNFHLMVFLYFAIQFTLMSCAASLNLYMAESYPTQIRNTGFGIINASGRCAVAVAQWLTPYLYAAFGSPGLGLFICGVCLVGGFAALLFGWRTGTASLEDCC